MRPRRGRSAVALAALVVATSAASATAGSQRIESTADGPSSPGVGLISARGLLDVSAVSAHDVWEVGWQTVGGRDHGLIRHWDGESWSDIVGADLGSQEVRLGDVAALSSSDVWVTGT